MSIHTTHFAGKYYDQIKPKTKTKNERKQSYQIHLRRTTNKSTQNERETTHTTGGIRACTGMTAQREIEGDVKQKRNETSWKRKSGKKTVSNVPKHIVWSFEMVRGETGRGSHAAFRCRVDIGE